MKWRNFSLKLCASLACLMPVLSPLEAVLAGIKVTGRAATSVSAPNDAFAAAYNPAASVLVPDRIDNGISWVHFNQELTVEDNESILNIIFPDNQLNGTRNAAKTADVYVPEFGVVKHFCRDICGCPLDFVAGLTVYNRYYLKTTYGRNIPLFGTSPVGVEYLMETVAPNFAVRLSRMHSIGLALNINVQRVKINGIENFANPLFSSSPENATNKGYNWSTGFGVTLGYLFTPWDNFRIGVSWTPKTHMRRFHKYKGFLADRGKFDNPMRFQAGISWDPWDCLTLAADYEYIRWRDIPHLRNPLLPNLLDSHLGDPDGAGFGWNNQHYYRFGVEYHYNKCWDFRAGFRHSKSPIPPSQAAINLLTMEACEDVLTLGTTYHVNPCNELTILYAYGFSHTVYGKNSIPSVPIPFPPFPNPVNVFGGGEANIKQSLQVLGLSYGRRF